MKEETRTTPGRMIYIIRTSLNERDSAMTSSFFNMPTLLTYPVRKMLIWLKNTNSDQFCARIAGGIVPICLLSTLWPIHTTFSLPKC